MNINEIKKKDKLLKKLTGEIMQLTILIGDAVQKQQKSNGDEFKVYKVRIESLRRSLAKKVKKMAEIQKGEK